jgi:hypothetical protein
MTACLIGALALIVINAALAISLYFRKTHDHVYDVAVENENGVLMRCVCGTTQYFPK